MAVKQDQVQVKLTIDGKQAGSTLNDMSKEVSKLNRELGKLAPGTQEFKDKVQQLNAAKDRLKGVRDEVNGVQTGLKGMLSSAKDSISGMAPLGAAAIGAFAVEKLVEFGAASVASFNEAENAAFQMRNTFVTLGGEGEEALQRLLDQADMLEEKTFGFTAEQINTTQQQLKIFGLTAEEIEKLTPKILDYATATGKDLTQATQDVRDAMMGQTEQLGKAGIMLDKSKVSVQGVTDSLDKFKGTAENALNVGTNKFEIWSDRWGKVEEAVGGGLVTIGNFLFDLGEDIVGAFQTGVAGGQAFIQAIGQQWDQLGTTAKGVFDGLGEIIAAPFTDGTVEGGYKKLYDALNRDTTSFGSKFQENFNKILAESTKPAAGDGEIRKKIADRVIPKPADGAKQIEAFAEGSLAQLKKLLADVEKQIESTADQTKLAGLIAQERTIKAGIADIERQLADLRGENITLTQLGFNFEFTDEEIEAALTSGAELQEDITAQELAATKERQDQVNAALRSASETRLQIANEEAEKKKAIEQAAIDSTISVVYAGIDALAQLSDRRAEREIRNAELVKDATISQLDQQLERREISQAAYDKRREAAEALAYKRSESARIKAARQQKALSLAQSIINTAEAVTKALGSAPPPVNLILAAGVGAVGAIQTGLIASQPIYRKGGVANGPSHEQGGIKMVNSQNGQIVGEMEGGEPYMILSGNTYRNNRQIVDALLHSSTRRNGAPIFDAGGVFAPGKATGSISGGMMSDMAVEIRALRADMARWQTAIRAYIVYDDLQQTTDDVSSIKAAAGR